MSNLKELIEQKSIKFLCHFVLSEKLEQIKTEGLLIPENIKEYAGSGVSDRENAVCLSISELNRSMFSSRLNKNKDAKYSLLLINPYILFEKKCLFFPTNAKSGKYQNQPERNFMGLSAFEKLFDNLIPTQKFESSGTEAMRDLDFFDCITTSNQAEVRCYENIEPKFIIDTIDNIDENVNFMSILESSSGLLDLYKENAQKGDLESEYILGHYEYFTSTSIPKESKKLIALANLNFEKAAVFLESRNYEEGAKRNVYYLMKRLDNC